MELRIAQSQSEFNYRQELFVAAENLHKRGGLAEMQLSEERKRKASRRKRAQANRSREASAAKPRASSFLKANSPAARRNWPTREPRSSFWKPARAPRTSTPSARRARLAEEFNFFKELETKAEVSTPVGGLVVTPRLKEKAGQYLEKGELICVIEDLSSLEAEIAVSEQDASLITPGESVSRKPRSQPYLTLRTQVDRIASAATLAEKATHSTVTVYCRLDNTDGTLRSGMTGFGRIHHQKRPLGLIALDRVGGYLRTEFWW